jgi:hypothetical protein
MTTHFRIMPRLKKIGSIHPLPIRLYEAVLNYLSTGTTIPFLSPKPFLQPALSSPTIPWQRLLTEKILQLDALNSFHHKLPYRTNSVAPLVFGMDRVETFRFQQYLYCSVSIRYCGNVFTGPLPRNVSRIFAYFAVVA